MTALEITGLIAGLVTAIATGVTAVYVIWWRDRRSATIPFYRVLKASMDDPDPHHWVLINGARGLSPPVLDQQGYPVTIFTPAGKVVKITRTTVTLDHPRLGNESIDLSHVHSVRRTKQSTAYCKGWTPRFDSDGRGPVVRRNDEASSDEVQSKSSTS